MHTRAADVVRARPAQDGALAPPKVDGARGARSVVLETAQLGRGRGVGEEGDCERRGAERAAPPSR